jgi:hypothetical protein
MNLVPAEAEKNLNIAMGSNIIILTIFTFFLHVIPGFAQSDTSKKPASGKVIIQKDYRVDSLINRHIRINNEKQSIPGYRIQVYFGSTRTEALSAKADFIKKYPDVKIYMIYEQPNYKIRAGDFTTRYEAEKYHKQIIVDFKSCFIVPDEISLPEL